jgi:formamidopyrimidine-DNA glycosylase
VGAKGLHMGRKPPRAAIGKLVGATFTGIRRHGKYLLLDTDTPRSLLVHLGMTGRLRIHKRGEPRAAHTHMVLDLGARELRYVDARRFGQVDVIETAHEREHAGLAVLGPDPITHGIDGEALYATARGKKTMLKALVLDQGVIAGMGNIYASEALWRAQLRPTKRANKLTHEGALRLAAACRDVLHDALANNGTSLRDFVDADGAEGSNWEYLDVYDRAGQPCKRCKTSIKRIVLQGRATYFCPTCQTP